MDNKNKIEELKRQIGVINEQIAELEEQDRLPELERKIQKYLTNSYSGSKLLEKHSLFDTGVWQIKGEDPNCDLGGSHHNPDLGLVQGTLKDALTYALQHKNFYTWGGGGIIEKVNLITPNNGK